MSETMIEKAEAIEAIKGAFEYPEYYGTAIRLAVNAIKQMPTVEAKPVVHAYWIYGETIYGVEWMKCSACCKSQIPTGVFSYCPNCGAQMDEKED